MPAAKRRSGGVSFRVLGLGTHCESLFLHPRPSFPTCAQTLTSHYRTQHSTRTPTPYAPRPTLSPTPCTLHHPTPSLQHRPHMPPRFSWLISARAPHEHHTCTRAAAASLLRAPHMHTFSTHAHVLHTCTRAPHMHTCRGGLASPCSTHAHVLHTCTRAPHMLTCRRELASPRSRSRTSQGLPSRKR